VHAPLLSIIVIVYRMPRQAGNTLFSLSSNFQRGVNKSDYEVIVVENSSDANLDESTVLSMGENFRYFRREESGVSPVPAINFALEQCRAPNLGLIIDGARMLSPRTLQHVLHAFRINANALVSVPGYHLGEQDQKSHLSNNYGEAEEQRLLQQVQWQANGYGLFDIACFSSGNKRGYLQPFMESSALFCQARHFQAIGGADNRFTLAGGGSINLHIYRSLGMLPETQLFILPGEGSFHQFHGGITTSEYEQRDAALKSFKDQIDSFWDGQFKALTREPVLLGNITRSSQRHLLESLGFAQKRFARLTQNGKPIWEDEAALPAESLKADSIPLPPTLSASNTQRPRLSVVVIVFNMPRQAMNTLYSLSTQYQQQITADDYEIIVVENDSGNNLDASAVQALGDNFSYYCRQESGVSPAAAINFGYNQARGDLLGLVIDGARLVTPRALFYAMSAFRLGRNLIVSIPGHNLGPTEHHYNVSEDYNEDVEQGLLKEADWKQHGYRLFDISSIGGANPRGIFHPTMESNCLFTSIENFEAIGQADMDFQLPGGGALNLHMYRSLGLLPGCQIVVVPGEGTFHQFHGGVTTRETSDREQILERQHAQLQNLWNNQFRALSREPTLFGTVTGHALPFMEHSCHWASKRFNRLDKERKSPWPDDDLVTSGHQKKDYSTE